jgi:hypothetical protein
MRPKGRRHRAGLAGQCGGPPRGREGAPLIARRLCPAAALWLCGPGWRFEVGVCDGWPLRGPLDMSVGWACGRARGRGALREGPSGMGD